MITNSGKIQKLLVYVVIVLLCLPAIRPLLQPGFFTMHDDQQIVRLVQMDQALKGGQFPVRWVNDLGFGYGYPLFNFYPPLVYYLGEVYYLALGISYIQAMKLVFATSFIAAALSMYWWVGHHFGQLAGVIGALFYTYAPYRAVDAYVRGALAEAFSFVWLPLLLLSMDRLAELVINHSSVKSNKQKVLTKPHKAAWWVLLLGISYAALMVTHNLIVLPFTLIMTLYYGAKMIPLTWWERGQFTLSLIPAALLGLSLSAFFWLPSLSEMQFTLVDEILLVERYDHSLHYAEPTQLWNSLWGYGGSSPDQLDGFTLKIGKLHLVLALGVGFVSILGYLGLLNDLIKKNALLVTCFGLLAFSAWMTTPNSAVIWDNFPPIQFLQFPWRFLTFTTLFSSILAGASVWFIHQAVSQRIFAFSYSLLIIGILFYPNLKLFQPQTYLDVTDSYYTSDDFTKWRISKTSFEFVPKGVDTTTDNELEITQLNINEDEIATEVYNLVNGHAEVTLVQDLPHRKSLGVVAETVSQIRFNTFNFPGWRLYINDSAVPINDENRLKLISTLIPVGEHLVEIEFGDTPVRTLGNSLSLMGWVVVVGLAFLTWRKDSKSISGKVLPN